ncbi:hypothetical protein APHAL10511_004432 [Amanita phalloides]|nr:hypothetical protein APHAL10511_004432 [Amanita phalloides]
MHPDRQDTTPTNLFMKGPKRKRLAKACDACHKSKRRCDGTAPCSNCYYASKTCTYTDASGRPVPAPRPFSTERGDPQPSSQPYADHHSDPSRYSQHGNSSSTQATIINIAEDDSQNVRKRIRNDRSNLTPTDDALMDGPISGPSIERPTHVKLDHVLTRELTNLFFTHCHPARIIIHKPSFSTALSHNQVSQYLIHAICALAAPLSKQPRIRTNPARFAGKPFALEAMSLMFDGAGRLVCEPNLATAQALCLLQIHDIITKDKNMRYNTRYHDLALQIVNALGVHSPDHPLLTPVPSAELIQSSLERESVRRVFWLIHMLDVMISIYFKRPLLTTDNELRLRLPADETSFELAVHSTLPEYLHLAPIKTQYASEFGHLLRVLMIYAEAEHALDYLTGLEDPDPSVNPATLIYEVEQKIREWSNLLPEHLQFSRDSLSVQQSMFETSSNDGAWCYCCMHVYHASTLIALNNAQQLVQRAPVLKVGPQWATDMLDQILTMLGDRGKHSLLMSAALWTYAGLCGRDDPQVHIMARDYEEYWGTRMLDLVRDWRSRMSPHQQQLHQFITPPQKYGQPTSFKRRTSCETPFSDSHAYHRDLSFGLVPVQMQMSSNESSRIDLSRPSTSDSSTRHHSPSPSPNSYPSKYPEDTRHVNSLWHQQSDIRASTSTSVHPGISGQEANHGSELQGSMSAWESLRQERYQMGYNEWVKKENESSVGIAPLGAGGSGQNVTSRDTEAYSVGNGPNTEGPQLPSLKASGLLDSWVSASRMPERTQDMPLRKSPLGILHRKPSPGQMDVGDTPRSSNTSSLPVGLKWLANEPRQQ